MSQILNRTNAPQIIRFFDTCFKKGVVDAYEHGDDLDTKEFLDSRTEDWRFGILGEPDDFDWQMFRFTLYWWARKAHMKNLAEQYIFKVRKKSYIWSFLIYCMRFYLLGIKEWLDYPNPVRIEFFKANGRLHWDPKSEFKRFTTGDYISYMHEFAYAHRRIPDELKQISDGAMDGLCMALYDLTRKYERGEDPEEEDI